MRDESRKQKAEKKDRNEGGRSWNLGARHFPRAADPKRLRVGQATTVAGSAGPGFHNWPPGHIPQNTAPNPLLRSRPHAKKTFGGTFGETFGAATGVSDPRLQKTQIRNNHAGGKAAL